MTPTTIRGYEFGEFVLLPSSRLLLHLNNPVQIREKELDILTHLATHASRNVTTSELIAAVWGAEVNLAAGNVSHHIARIRKVLGCDARRPKYVRTLPGNKGYRFIAAVTEKDFDQNFSFPPSSTQAGTLLRLNATIHLFSPVFLGERAFEVIGSPVENGAWHDYKEFRLESARLLINRSGFGVWHIETRQNFLGLKEVAAWRKQIYREILGGKHVINRSTKHLIKSVNDDSPLNEHLGRFGYVFSFAVLNDSNAKRNETVRNVLRILSSLRSLEPRGNDDNEREDLERRERQMIDDGFEPADIRPFGLPGADIGFASWGGVSYFDARHGGSIESGTIEFEIAVQSLWWLCKCLIELRLKNGESATVIVRMYLAEVRRQYSMIKNIGATDSPSRRTMIEAVVETSRIKDMVEEVIHIVD